MSKAAIYARTPAQQQKLRENFQQRLATYRRPEPGGGSFVTPERSISHFRCEYEHMPLMQFWHCLRDGDTGHYYVLHQSGPKDIDKTPTLLGRDVLNAARIWREERDRWVQQWLAEAQQLYGLTTLPAAEGTENNVYGHKVPGIPVDWLLATHEWPEMDWSRETPGVFEVYEQDLDELRRLPHNLDGVGSCEPEEFEVMDERKLPDLAALSRVILALYDAYGEDSVLTRMREIRRDGEWYTILSFDCRSWLKAEVAQEGGGRPMAEQLDSLAWLQEEKIYLVQTLDHEGDAEEDFYVYAQNVQEAEDFLLGHLAYELKPQRRDRLKIPYGPSDFETWKQEGGCFSLKPDEILNRPGQVGWACTKPRVTKHHYYGANGNSLCRYQRQPGLLHFWKKKPYGSNRPESTCSSCELAYSRLPKAEQR